MSKWKYELESGANLRKAIDDDDNVLTLDALAECYKEIHRRMPEAYGKYELENDLDEIENQRDNLENHDEYEMSLKDCEDDINYLLRDFYDFCDANRIWVKTDTEKAQEINR